MECPIDIMNNENISVKELSRKTKLKYSYTVDQIKNGRKLKRIFRAGLLRLNSQTVSRINAYGLLQLRKKEKGKHGSYHIWKRTMCRKLL